MDASKVKVRIGEIMNGRCLTRITPFFKYFYEIMMGRVKRLSIFVTAVYILLPQKVKT